MSSTVSYNLQTFQTLKTDLFQKDFLLTWEHPEEEIRAILILADTFKRMHQQGKSSKSFDTGLAISIFRDNSTRTRFSFASRRQRPWPGPGRPGRAEKPGGPRRDRARDRQHDQLPHRGDRHPRRHVPGRGPHLHAGSGRAPSPTAPSSGVLHRRPSIVNLQCDIDHPTQALADLGWLQEHFGSVENLKGKKIAMTWAYSPSYGKPLSVPQGIIGLMTRFGMDVRLAHPEGYDLIPDVVELAGKQAAETGGKFKVTTSMEEAFDGADIVYPKSWAPYHVMERRTELLKVSDKDGLSSWRRTAWPTTPSTPTGSAPGPR